MTEEERERLIKEELREIDVLEAVARAAYRRSKDRRFLSVAKTCQKARARLLGKPV